MSEQLLLDLAYLQTPIQLTAVYFRAHTRKSTIHHMSRCHRGVLKHRDPIFGAFLSTNRLESFYERLGNYVGYVLLSQFHDRSHDDVAISVSAQHQWFLTTTTDFRRPSRNPSWSKLRPRLNSPYHR